MSRRFVNLMTTKEMDFHRAIVEEKPEVENSGLWEREKGSKDLLGRSPFEVAAAAAWTSQDRFDRQMKQTELEGIDFFAGNEMGVRLLDYPSIRNYFVTRYCELIKSPPQ